MNYQSNIQKMLLSTTLVFGLTSTLQANVITTGIEATQKGVSAGIIAGIAACMITPYGPQSNLAIASIAVTTGLVATGISIYKKEIEKKTGQYGYYGLHAAAGITTTLLAIRASDPTLLPGVKETAASFAKPIAEGCISGACYVADRVTSVFFTGR